MSSGLERRLREILALTGDRVGKARRIAAAIRETGGYRWVGLCHGSADAIQVLAWSGSAPSSAPSRIDLPVRDGTGAWIGSLSVESDHPDAFSPEDRARLEACARLLPPLWG